MSVAENARYELDGRFREADLGKTHISVRFEPDARILRVGAMLDEYTWDNRMATIRALLAFERDHADDFAVGFDIVPLDAVVDETFASA